MSTLKEPFVILMNEDDKGHGVDPIFASIASISSSISQQAIIFLHTNINKENFQPIINYLSTQSLITLIIKPLLSDYGPTTEHNFRNRSLFHRLLFPYFYSNLNKYIFLDSDVIVLDDLSLLWELDLGTNLIGGVLEQPEHCLLKHEQLGTPLAYANAGVLLYNAEAWRNEIPIDFGILWAEGFNEPLYCTDQDAINFSVKGRILPIENKWNRMLKNGSFAAESNAKILHFAGPIKPWHPYSDFDFQLIFREWIEKVLPNWGPSSGDLNFAQFISIAHQLLRRGNVNSALDYYRYASNARQAPDWFKNAIENITPDDLSPFLTLCENNGLPINFLSPYELKGILS